MCETAFSSESGVFIGEGVRGEIIMAGRILSGPDYVLPMVVLSSVDLSSTIE